MATETETATGFALVWNEGPNYLVFGTKDFGPLRVMLAHGGAEQLAKIIRQYSEAWEEDRADQRAQDEMRAMSQSALDMIAT